MLLRGFPDELVKLAGEVEKGVRHELEHRARHRLDLDEQPAVRWYRGGHVGERGKTVATERGERPLADGSPFVRAVVRAHPGAVSGRTDINLDAVRTQREGRTDAGQRVVRVSLGETAVADD